MAALLLSGCGGTGEVSKDDFQAQRRMSLVAEIYGDYLGMHNGQPPKDDAEFKEFISHYERRMKAYDVSGPDELLTSPRDGQPLTVIYGKRIVSPEAPANPWAVYEQTGVDGARMAAQVRGVVENLPPEKFAALFPTK